MDVELGKVLGKFDQVSKLLLGKSFQEIVDFFDELLRSDEKPNRFNLLEALLVGVNEHEQLLDIYEHVVDFLWLNEVDSTIRPIFFSFLNNKLDFLEDWKAERLCFRMIQKLSCTCLEPSLLFDILAKVLVKLENSNTVSSLMVDSLCSVEWCSENMTCLLDVFSNYNLQQKSVEKILDNCLSKMASLEPNKLPAFIQSILLFSFPRYMEFLFLRLVPLICGNSCSAKSSGTIRGHFIMKLFSLVKENGRFGKTIFETIKCLPKSLIGLEFYYTILMTLLPIQSTQAHATQLLTTSILTAFSDSHLVSESSFLRDLCPLSNDPKEVILKLSEHCNSKQWEFTVQGMILLGFTLLQAACSSSTARSSGRSLKPLSSSPFQTHDTLKSRILRSGLDILLHIFKHCPCSRDEIITIIANLIWSDSTRSVALYALDLLSDLVAVFPLEVAMRADRLDPIIDSIGLIPLSISTGLVHALLPLIRAGSLLELGCNSESDQDDNLFNQVRKKLISNLSKYAQSPRISSRCSAVACFILLLKHLKVSISSFRSASQHSSSSSLSQPFTYSQSQATQRNPLLLFSQLQSTQIAQQAVLLPCDIVQNEVLCTEIIRILQRIIFSAVFRSQPGSLLADPENMVKSNIYWGLCEVVTRNRGLCEPIISLYLRLLTGCLSPNFLKTLKRPGAQNSQTVIPTQMNPTNPDFVHCPPFILSQLLDSNSVSNEILRSEHPDILIWCLQLILTLPLFNVSWKRFHCPATSNNTSESSQISSDVSNETSQFTQSVFDSSIRCGSVVTYPLFSKAVNLLISISDALRVLSKEDFGMTTETDFSSTAGGKLNRHRVHLLISIYDACLEFELKDPLGCGVSHTNNNNDLQTQIPNQASKLPAWVRIRQLFAKRLALLNLINNGKHAVSSDQNCGILSRHGSDSRCGLLIMSLISLSQANLRSILIASIKSDLVNPLACHVLQTVANRLNQFTRCTEGDIPCAYRDALVNELGSIMKSVVRFYHHKIMQSENPSLLPSHTQLTSTAATAVTTSVGTLEDEVQPNPSVSIKTRSTASTFSPASTALQVINSGMTLALHYLGTQRLHKLCRIMYPVTSDPNYTEQMLNQNSEVLCDSEDYGDNESSESMLSEITPALSLSCLIKLIKSWVTMILNPVFVNSSTQKLTAHNFPHAKDLVILLPLLVKLCRARAGVGSEVTNLEANRFNPYSGLSRVLAWLLRLMRAPIPSRNTSEANSTNVIATPARVQLINQTIWLAHLIGPNLLSRSSQTPDSDLGVDDIILSLCSDLTAVLGNVNDMKDISLVPDDLAVSYPLVTRSSALSILPLIYASMKHSIKEYEWLLNHISIDYAGRLDLNDIKDTEIKLDGNEKEEALCLRLIGLGEILAQLLQTALPAPSSHVDTLLEIIASVFSLLIRLTKYYLRIIRLRYGQFPVIFERLVRVYGREVSPRVYALFIYIQNSESEKVKGFQSNKNLKKSKEKDDCESGKVKCTSGIPQSLISRSIKDSRLIPQLIYVIEQYERFLIQLSTKSKINLMRHVKLSTARDFRINQAKVAAHFEQSVAMSVSSLSDESEPEADAGNLNNEVVDANNPTEAMVSSAEDEEDTDNRSEADDQDDDDHSSQYGDDKFDNNTTDIDEDDAVDENDCPDEMYVSSSLSKSRTETPIWGRQINPVSQRKSAMKRSFKSVNN
ncbi:Fanconi anemia group I protein [Schistosoma japonicum]|uniref:Fanconi anemia group I protein n=1 Tax=Schistosoma japonicum TaxID=6182 RepID=A0A4Z2CWN7_SCHJA|nr:Fanconi anemia group I protein [Schistosoma japonicum]